MRLSELEIIELHATGGMAEVYRARVVQEGGFEKQYAVKKILPQFTRDPELIQMFVEEARVAACLSFPNIVQVFDLCVSDEGEYFIVMEFADGKDLADVIHAAGMKGQRVSVAMAVQVAREILLALDYAQTAEGPDGRPLRLIHRDISPHNVIVGHNGAIKLTDFGIAKVQQSGHKTMAGVVKGKFGYMSPEQARGKKLDHRSDLYNVGILIYEMVTGERLFAGSSDISTLDRMRAALVPPLPKKLKAPAELDQLMRRSLSKSARDRPRDAAAFEMELAQIANRHNLRSRRSEIGAFMQGLVQRGRCARVGRTASHAARDAALGDVQLEGRPTSRAGSTRSRAGACADRSVWRCDARWRRELAADHWHQRRQAARPSLVGAAQTQDRPAFGRPADADRCTRWRVRDRRAWWRRTDRSDDRNARTKREHRRQRRRR